MGKPHLAKVKTPHPPPSFQMRYTPTPLWQIVIHPHLCGKSAHKADIITCLHHPGLWFDFKAKDCMKHPFLGRPTALYSIKNCSQGSLDAMATLILSVAAVGVFWAPPTPQCATQQQQPYTIGQMPPTAPCNTYLIAPRFGLPI